MIDETRVRELVRRVVMRTVEAAIPQNSRGDRVLVTQDQVEKVSRGGRLEAPSGALVTPLARQAALERRVTIAQAQDAPVAVEQARAESPAGTRAIALAADHGGFELKELLRKHLRDAGHPVIDCGTDGPGPVDYPDFALAAAQLVSSGRAWRAIVVDGAGIGSCIAANKVPGVRAAMCYDEATAVNSREHNHANVLTLGAGMIGSALARRIVDAWLSTPSGGDRHARRVQKIMDIERRYSKGSA